MKVLIIHNFYQSKSPSGENQLVLDEMKLLRSHNNIQVKEFFFQSDSFYSHSPIGKLKMLLNIPWNFGLNKKIKSTLREFKPDVIHIHNTFPFISPSIFYKLRKYPIIFTLHNYRIFCASGTPLRDNKICLECFEKNSFLPSLKYGCYRNSKIQTLPVFLKIVLANFFKVWEKYVKTFFVFSSFQKQLLSNTFLTNPNIRFVKKSNFMEDSSDENIPLNQREKRVVFIGRLSNEKGILQLLDAWDETKNDYMLSIIGDGPLLEQCAKRIKNDRVLLEGKKSKQEVMQYIKNSQLTIIPSICIEGFPMLIAESFSQGTPILASNYGPLPEYIIEGKTGFLIDPIDKKQFSKTIDSILNNKQILETVSNNCKEYFLNHLTSRRNLEILISEYSRAVNKIQTLSKD